MPEAPVENNEVEHFDPTSGRIMGFLGLLTSIAVIIAWAMWSDRDTTYVPAIGALAGVLAWAAMLRPRVSIDQETLFLRNMLQTIEVPLAAIDELVVRQVMAVRAGGRKYVSPAVGRTLRTVLGRPSHRQHRFAMRIAAPAEQPSLGSPKQTTLVDYADVVEQRLREAITDARQRHGVTALSEEAAALATGVRRRLAWPEIAALVIATAVVVVTLVL